MKYFPARFSLSNVKYERNLYFQRILTFSRVFWYLFWPSFVFFANNFTTFRPSRTVLKDFWNIFEHIRLTHIKSALQTFNLAFFGQIEICFILNKVISEIFWADLDTELHIKACACTIFIQFRFLILFNFLCLDSFRILFLYSFPNLLLLSDSQLHVWEIQIMYFSRCYSCPI